ncbi:MAG: aldehyde ferredoxin oxidoreductase family protein [Promethearchaeota archaeon]
MNSEGPYAGKIAVVNLSLNKIDEKDISVQERKKFIGGLGLASWMLYKYLKPGIDPLSPDNVIVFMTGPLTGTLAPCNRYVVTTKSPLTGAFLDSYAGGDFGQELKYAGFDGIVLIGRASKPKYLWIQDGIIELLDAAMIWGRDVFETEEILLKEHGRRTRVAVIGPAGENLVRFANIDSSPHRQAGRGGSGAVLGSKNVKAIAASGSFGVGLKDTRSFLETVRESHKLIEENDILASYRSGGTVSSLMFASEEGLLPTRNFQDGVFEGAEGLSDSANAERIWLRHSACFACTIHCSKIGAIQRGKYAGTECDTIEYESLALLGSNCGNSRLESVAYASIMCDRLGMDTMSTGAVIAFTIEAIEKGIISKDEFPNDGPKYGDVDSQLPIIEMISTRSGIGDLLADGVRLATHKLGTEAEAIGVHVKGLESPAWGPRGIPGMGLALATANCGGSHERAWTVGYEIDGEGPEGESLERTALDKKAKVVIWEQDMISALSCLVVCEFPRNALDATVWSKLIQSATGWDVSPEDLFKTGERVWNLGRVLNIREGLNRSDDRLPTRFSEPLPSGPTSGHAITNEDLKSMLDDYYSLRGWSEVGVPTPRTLRRLSVDELVKELGR